MTPETQSLLDRWHNALWSAEEAKDSIEYARREIDGDESLSRAITALEEFIETAEQKVRDIRGN